MLWVDNRQGNNDIYYTGATSAGPALVTKEINANSGGTVEDVISGTQVEIPSGALSVNTTISIAEILNPPAIPSGFIGGLYEFGPSGLEFSQPVTLTIPHTASDCLGYSVYNVYWYDEETGKWSQEGITNVQHIVLSPVEHAVTFQTTHFTGFGTGGSVGGGVSVGGGGGGGGGCSVSTTHEGNIVEFILPYIGFFIVLAVITMLDARVRKINNKAEEKC